MRRVSASEWRWVLVFATAVIAITALPYFRAAMQTEMEFTGFLFGVEDGNSYIAKMLLGAQGDWLFRSPYAPIEQAGALVYLPYLLLGKLMGPGATHSAFLIAFHTFRLASIVALCFATYEFISVFLSEVKFRKVALAICILGSGLGWLPLLIGVERLAGSIPLDFYSPETFGFLAVFGIPHLVIARALLLWGLASYLHGEEKGWLTALLWLILAACHMVTAALGLGLILLHVAYLGYRRDHSLSSYMKHFLWAGVGALPVLVSNAWSLFADPYIANWAAQNQILSPHPVHYLLSYGWLVPFAILGLRQLLAKGVHASRFLLIWLVALPFLIYAPVGLQRRLVEGAWVMLIVLSLYALESKPNWKLASNAVLALALPSTILLLVGAWQTASSPATPAFRARTEATAFVQLRTHINEGAIVLSSYSVGNALPAWVPATVLVGHGPEGINEAEFKARIAEFFAPETDEESRLATIRDNSVDFVFWGPEERKLGSWNPMEASFLVPIVMVEDVYIFRVADE